MSLVSLHRKYLFTDYQNRICSIPAIITLTVTLLAIISPFVWIFKVNGNKFSTSKDVAIFEQPIVKFQFKYLVLAENALDSSEKTVLCSSFDLSSHFDATFEKCSKFKFIEKDENFDGISDEMTFSFEMNTLHRYGIKSASVILFLDTRLQTQCALQVPSAVIISKKFPNDFNDRLVSITGSLQPIQIQPVVCPFFMRNIKSHFFFAKIDGNLTNVEDFRPSRIRENLEKNPLHFNFQESPADDQRFDSEKTTIVIKMKIPEVAIRYRKSFWKTLNDFWMNYFAIFAVTYVIANLLLNCLFEKRWLMARKKGNLHKID